MMEGALELLLRRDRIIVAAALILLVTIAWGYLLWRVDAMSVGDMEMLGLRMDGNPFGMAIIPSFRPWSAADLILMFVMWTIMMVGMMIPSAAPMILVYARVARQARMQGKPLASTAYFAGGYLLAWTAFSLVATICQWLLERASLLSPMMDSTSNIFGGIVLIVTGLFQWTPLKDFCAKYCQAPLMFIQRHGSFRRHPLGSLSIGFRHGLYCVGCCWALMALLFVGGVMNALWIAGIAIFALAEKAIPAGRVLSRMAGLGLTAAGVWWITTTVQ